MPKFDEELSSVSGKELDASSVALPSFSDRDGDSVAITFDGLPSFASYSGGTLKLNP